MTPKRDELYAAALAADKIWWDALVKAYGKMAAQYRYTFKGKEGEFAPMYAAVQAANRALRDCAL